MSVPTILRRSALFVLLPWSAIAFAQHSTANYTQTVNKATPGAGSTAAVTVASSLNPSTYTAGVTFTASLPTAATGSIKFYDGATLLGTGMVNSGSATLGPITTLAVGSHSITAQYQGDSNFNAATSSAISQVVNQASTAVTLTSSNLNPVYAQSVTFTAAVPAGATGTVTYKNGSTTLGTGTVSGGTATFTTSTLTAGSYSITAVYGGDTNYLGSTSPAITENVGQVPAGTVISASTEISSLNPSLYSQNVTFTATLPSGATGTVTFYDGTTAISSAITLAANTAAYSTNLFTVAGSVHSITGHYSGDTNFAAATLAAISQTVNQAPTITEISASPSTGIAVGSSVTLTALVDTDALTPTGTVTFLDGGATLGTGTVSVANATNLLPYSANFSQWTADDSGASAPTVGSAVAGPDGQSGSATSISYPSTTGGGIFSGFDQAATGSYASQAITFSIWTKGAATGSLSVVIADGSHGNAQTGMCAVATTWTRCSVTVTMPAGSASGLIASLRSTGVAAQTVSLFGGQLEQAATAGPYILTTGGVQSGTGGMATFSTSALLNGAHSITAQYSGDSNYLGSTSSTDTLSVGKGTSSAVVTSSNLNTSYGSPVTFTATLSGPGTTPTGTVTFYDGAASIGTGTLNGSGIATLTISTLTAGSHAITVQYGGDSNFNSATSAAITQNVAVVAVTINVTSSENPSVFGDNVTFTITLIGTAAVPTGTVALTDGGSTLGTLTLNASGVATYSTTALPAGSDVLTVTYSGDSNYK